MKIRLGNEKGFSILEIIAAITIISIIMAIAAPNFFGLVERSKDKSDNATANTIGKAMELYISEGEFDSDKSSEGKIDNKGYDENIKNLIEEGFISNMDPPQNSKYDYWHVSFDKGERKVEVFRAGGDGGEECLYQNTIQ